MGLIGYLRRIRTQTSDTTEVQKQLEVAWLLDHRSRGLPVEMICGPIPAGLDVDERALCVLPEVNLLECRAVRRSLRRGRRASGGPTIRLAPGLSFRFGNSGSTGTSESETFDELRKIDQGVLVLTMKRLAFLGSLRTNSSSLDDLIGVTDVSGGIQVHREHKEKAETYLFNTPLTIDGVVITGAMLKLAIEMAKMAEAADVADRPAKFKWKVSPYTEDPNNPLKSGSLYES